MADLDSETGQDRSGAFLLAAGVFLFAVASFPGLFGWPMPERNAIAIVIGAAGIGYLVQLARSGEQASRWLIAFLLWTFVSALLSTVPLQVLLPGIAMGATWPLWVSYGGWWALGNHVGPYARQLVERALVSVLLLNVAMGVGQALGGGKPGLLSLPSGRAMGFLGNSVYFGAFVAGVGVLVFIRSLETDHQRWWLASIPMLAVGLGLNLSGSRVALGAFLAVAGTGIVSRRNMFRRAIPLAAAVTIGIGLAVPLLQGGATDRVSTSASSGMTPRMETWRAGADAFLERPVQGWGIGRWGEATASRSTALQARADNPFSTFGDAHNLIIEIVVTTGVVGTFIIGGFVRSVARRVRGPALFAAITLLLTTLLQPLHPITAALSMFLLGLAMQNAQDPQSDGGPPPDIGVPLTRTTKVVSGLSVIGGLLLVIPILVAARKVHLASTNSDSGAAITQVGDAARWQRWDTVVKREVVSQHIRRADETGATVDVAAAKSAIEELIALDPTDYWGYQKAGSVELSFRADEDRVALARARDHFIDSYNRYPTHPLTLTWLRWIDSELGDDDGTERWSRELCEIEFCPEEPSDPTEPSTF